MVEAIISEWEMKRSLHEGQTIDTIYFGGGTPSLLLTGEILQILNSLYQYANVNPQAEITLEANPDDLTSEKLAGLKAVGVNRLSIGIQTFDESRLQYINRAHTTAQATSCLPDARAAGFDNISADLIYAIPPEDMNYWQQDLHRLLTFDPEHISLYGLTIEEKTVFGNWARKGKLTKVKEGMAADQYRLAIDTLKAHGYEHYEISNFAKPGKQSRHNSAYWDDKPYIGLGPGAHSYDGNSRSYNVSHNAKYLKSIAEGKLPATTELLSPIDKINEYIFTHLRTSRGIKLHEAEERYQRNILKDHGSLISQYCDQGLMEIYDGRMRLTTEGFMVADEISYRLFYDA